MGVFAKIECLFCWKYGKSALELIDEIYQLLVNNSSCNCTITEINPTIHPNLLGDQTYKL